MPIKSNYCSCETHTNTVFLKESLTMIKRSNTVSNITDNIPHVQVIFALWLVLCLKYSR